MLVDTSVWIDFLNGHESAHASRLAQAISGGEPIAVPGVVLTEVLLGLKSDQQAASIEDLMTAFNPVAELDRSGHANAARLYRLCRANGFTVRSTIDCLIAQMCLRDDLPLLTKDRDFTSIAASAPLKLVAVSQQ
jgi:predicted nucleic acid-binding protein